jgi:hypothetical protein
MDKHSFAYDVFISASEVDLAKGRELQDVLSKSGLRSYLYTENRIAQDFEKKVLEALPNSEYFVVLASPDACVSKWVKKEHKIFSEYEAKDPSRKIFRMKIGKGCEELLPPGILHAETIETLAPEIVRYYVDQRRSDCSELSATVRQVQEQLQKRDGEAFGHYRRSRFWRQLTADARVHIFTCGRDTAPDDVAGGRGSRTTIDKWDYKTVLDITHFLNRYYPTTHVQIEDPVSKLSHQDLREIWAADRLAKLQGLLRNRNCIIVGSPDVSDFAEIVLAATHDIRPYESERVKHTGYVIIKDAAKVSAPSSQYWTTSGNEEAGVAKLGGAGPEFFPTRVHSTGSGEMCGILAVVSNPFSDSPRADTQRHRIVLLSGFSGVATNAIAKFLTDDVHLSEFGRFDREYVDVEANIEVLIAVNFSGQARAAYGDKREIRGVSYRGLVVV